MNTIQEFNSGDLFTMARFNEMIEQINTSCTTLQTEVNNAVAGSISVPKGAIVMWSGAVDQIPGSWHLCDGTSGTPDLRGRFIVGAGGSYAVGSTGGAETVALTVDQMPVHSHSITGAIEEAGSHNHTTRFGGKGVDSGPGSALAKNTSNNTELSTSTDGAHTHAITATAANTGGGSAHENRPPYYALCYIMRII